MPDEDHILRFGGDASQARRELAAYRADIEATTAAAQKLANVSGAAAQRRAGGAGGAAGRGADAAQKEAEKAAKAEEQAFIQGLKNVDRQRQESARLAAALRRDEQRDLAAFGARQRNQTKTDIAEQDRLKREAATRAKQYQREQEEAAARAANVTRGQVADAWGVAGKAVLAATAAVVLFAGAVAKISFDAFSKFVHTGIEFNNTMEQARLHIAAMVGSFYEIKNASGQTVTGVGRLNAGLGLANDLTKQISIGALATNATTSELVEIYQGAFSGFAKAKIPLEQTVPLTIKLTQAAQTLGVENGKIGQQIRQILTGNVRVNTQLFQRLGLTKQELDQWRQQGTLVENLNKRLESFALAGIANQKTFAGLASNLQDAFEILGGLATSQLFDKLKEAALVILPALFDLKNFQVQPQIQAIVSFLDSSLGKIGGLVVALAKKAIDYLYQISAFIERNRATLDSIVNIGVELVSQSINLLELAVETLSTLHLVTTATGNWGNALKIVRAAFIFVGLSVATTADLLENMGSVALTLKGRIVAGMLSPLKIVIDTAAYLLDIFGNIGRVLTGWGPSIAGAAAALATGNFAGAVAAFQNLPSLSDLTGGTKFGDEVRAFGAYVGAYAAANRQLGNTVTITSANTQRFLAAVRQGPDSTLQARGSFGYTTSALDLGGGAGAGASKAAQGAAKLDEQIKKVTEDIARMRSELGLSDAALKEIGDRFGTVFNNKIGPSGSEARITEFTAQASEIYKILQAQGIQARPTFLDQARELETAANQAIAKFAQGVQIGTGKALQIIKPTADQLTAFAAATHEKLNLEYVQLIRTTSGALSEIDAKIKQYTEATETGADTAAKQFARLQDEIRETNKVIDASFLKDSEKDAKKRDFAAAITGAFDAGQKAKIEGFWRDVAAVQADVGQTESDRQLADQQAQADAFAAKVYANTTQDEASRKEADAIVYAYRNALSEKYWRDEAGRTNEQANTQIELANKLLLNDRERVKAQRELNALRAAQALDPQFQVGAEGNAPAAQAAFNASIANQSQSNIGDITGQLFDKFKSVSTGALPSVFDAQNITAAAKAMEDYGITLEQVAAIFGTGAETSGEFLEHVNRIANAQASGAPAINTTTEAMKRLVKETFASKEAFTSFGLAAGQALADLVTGSGDAASNLKRFFFNLIGDLAIQFGALAIAAGTVANAMPWFGLTGTAAVVAGIALVTLGGFFKGLAGSVGQDSSGSASGAGTAGGGATPASTPRDRPTPRTPFNTSGEQAFSLQITTDGRTDSEVVGMLMRHLEDRGMLSLRTGARGKNRNLTERRRGR